MTTTHERIKLNDEILRTIYQRFEKGSLEEKIRIVSLVASCEESEYVVSFLVIASVDTENEVRLGALEALRHRYPKRLEKLAPTFLTDKHPSVRQLAVEVIGNRQLDDLLSLIDTPLSDPDAGVRRAAVEVLCTDICERTAQRLKPLVNDPDILVRRQVVTAFAQGLKPIPVRQLLHLVEDEDRWVRLWTVEALRTSGERMALSGLVRFLRDKDVDVVSRAIHALGYLGYEEVIPHLHWILIEKPELGEPVNQALRRLQQTVIQPRRSDNGTSFSSNDAHSHQLDSPTAARKHYTETEKSELKPILHRLIKFFGGKLAVEKKT